MHLPVVARASEIIVNAWSILLVDAPIELAAYAGDVTTLVAVAGTCLLCGAYRPQIKISAPDNKLCARSFWWLAGQ